jgi:general secretion pathway protein I
MTLSTTPSCRRHGLSLLEVLVALAVFLFALIAIGRLVTLGGDRALDVQRQSQAIHLCQSKLAEVMAGVVPLASQGDVPFDEDPSWTWSLDCEQNTTITGLWNVTVSVTQKRSGNSKVECSLHQMVLDPSLRGSTLDASALASASSSSSASNSRSGSNSPASGATGGTGSGSMAPATKGAAGGTASPSSTATPTKASTSGTSKKGG